MSLISVTEALQAMHDFRLNLGQEHVQLEEATGRILQESIVADRDFPPFDRVTKDGIAIKYETYQNGTRQFIVKGIQAAGTTQTQLHEVAGCLEVMTGAILPAGTDTVIMYEQIEITDGLATIHTDTVKPQQNIHFRGMDAQVGDVLLQGPCKLTSGHVNTLATIGKSRVTVSRLPRVAIISTGDELVALNKRPEPHQIRKSNVYALKSLLREEGMHAELYHINDEQDAVLQELGALLEKYDVLLVTGGVSKGKYDFVPDALEKLGVRKVFHGVKQRPGKPFWFGTKEAKRVFAFPGNPVSTFVCYQVYFKVWLGHSIGWPLPQIQLHAETGPALENFWHHRLVKTTWDNQAQAFKVDVLHTSGSGDLVSLNQANGILSVPPQSSEEQQTFIPISSNFYDFIA